MNKMTLALSILCLTVAGITLIGCSGVDSDERVSWMKSGTLSVFKPAPSASEQPAYPLPGFLPSSVGHKGSWLSIESGKGTLRLMEDDQAVFSAQIASKEIALKPGTYSVIHKQRNPLWHADNEYFISRGIPVPKEGERARFLRGALGDFAIFVENEEPIHSGPFFSNEIGGARLSDLDMSKIYYSVQVGARVEVK